MLEEFTEFKEEWEPRMAAIERTKHKTSRTEVPILIGTQSRKFADANCTHQWSVYVRPSFESRDARLFEELVCSVEFALHPTFACPVRTLTRSPFEIEERGWGEFRIAVKITTPYGVLKTGCMLKLFPDTEGAETPEDDLLVSDRIETLVIVAEDDALLKRLRDTTAVVPKHLCAAEDAEYRAVVGMIMSVCKKLNSLEKHF